MEICPVIINRDDRMGVYKGEGRGDASHFQPFPVRLSGQIGQINFST
jgi:hypothetical protein